MTLCIQSIIISLMWTVDVEYDDRAELDNMVASDTPNTLVPKKCFRV